MPWTRPTLAGIMDRVRTDLWTALESSPILRRSVAGVLAKAISGATHMLHGHLEYLARQINPLTAEGVFLERWAGVWRISRRSATFAMGEVTFTGEDGTLIPGATLLQHPQTGNQYETGEDATIVDGSVAVPISALAPGPEGNLDPGMELELVSPIAGVESAVAISSSDGISGGLAVEEDEPLRARMLVRIQTPPAGGNNNDYVVWAKEVSGVTRAWCFPSFLGSGTVGVAFTVDDHPVSVIPDLDKVAEVQEHIDAVRPVTADLFVFAPIPKEIDFEIQVSPDASEVRQAVEAELRDLIRRDAAPGGATNSDGTILLSRIREAISTAAGEEDHTLISPTTNQTVSVGEIAVFGSITWA